MSIRPVNSTQNPRRGFLETGKLALGLIIMTPAVTLLAYWLAGEAALVTVALALPLLAALQMLFPGLRLIGNMQAGHSDILAPAAFNALVSLQMDKARVAGQKSAVFFLQIDDFADLTQQYGQSAMDSVKRQVSQRLRTMLRGEDAVGEVRDAVFGICLFPQPMIDLETCLQLAGRINAALNEPYAVDGTKFYLTVSMGFCQLGREVSSQEDGDRDPVSICAETALSTALSAAPSAIRAFAPEKRLKSKLKGSGTLDAISALENGEIVPWFQPQISTDTGRITGFEALARWVHPVRGPVSPAEFIPQLEDAGHMARLSEVIIYHALTAIKAWDQAEAGIHQVGVNFSSAELNDPKLIEKIAWELDRFDLDPSRLVVEVLETVVTKGPDDVIIRNIKGLNELGCRIDLDDFGTGHASLSSIRRFGVGRIKIDRSFVMKADRDVEQQRMIRAILTMAEKLDIETLAEGVETVGEHSLLAQLGCTYVQGFGIGRPMPFDQTLTWIRDHNSKLQEPPKIGRATR